MADGGLSSSEDAIRLLKSSESVEAAFHAEGFPSPPAGIAAMVADLVRSATQSIPLKQIANMGAGTGSLSNAASAAVHLVMDGLTAQQKEVMKVGGNPFNAAEVARISELLLKHGPNAVAAALSSGDKGERVASLGSSGASRYGAVKDTGSTVAPEVVAAYARDQGVSWVGGHPDVLRLGPSAVKAFADVGMKEESYRRFTQEAGFSAKDAVTVAKIAKERGQDGNKLTNEMADVVTGLAGKDPAKADRLRRIMIEYLKNPADVKAKEAYDKELKQYENDPAKKDLLDRARKIDKQAGKEQGAAADAAIKHQRANAEQRNATTAAGAEKAAENSLGSLLAGSSENSAQPSGSTSTGAQPARSTEDAKAKPVPQSKPAP